METANALQSVRPKAWLSDKIWDEKGLRPDVSNSLARVAKKFLEELEIDLDVEDIILTGSYAGKTWGPGSDLDLHIVADMSSIEDPEAVKRATKLAKFKWDEDHDVTINGVPVEVYVEDSGEDPPKVTGRWSITRNKWDLEPPADGVSFDESKVMDKVQDFRQVIQKASYAQEEGPLLAAMKRIAKLRQAGLERDGELSNENLAYRVLRRTGELQAAWDLINDLVDDRLSLK